jgi:hypothetical protein
MYSAVPVTLARDSRRDQLVVGEHGFQIGREQILDRDLPLAGRVTRRATVMARKNCPRTDSKLARLRANGSTGRMSP